MNSSNSYAVRYPRMRFQRTLVRLVGRLVLPTFFRITVIGRQHFPKSGPLIVVGNHVATMEVALMFVYTPWLVEFFGGGDIPHEPVSAFFARLVGYIPVMRGSLDRPALRAAVGILEQGGILGVFPEGGIWQMGSEKKAQPGVAWLSAHAHAPVLPIYYSGTRGSLEAALKFKRPALHMNVGPLLPAAILPENALRKSYLQNYADRVLEAVQALRPPGEILDEPAIRDERFELEIAAYSATDLAIPALAVRHPESLARLLHTPTVMKIFDENLRLPVRPLQTLNQRPSATDIASACASILNYLETQNPYMLTYRFGPRLAEEMRLALEDVRKLAEQAARGHNRLEFTPIRRYILVETGQEITQTEQGFFKHWM